VTIGLAKYVLSMSPAFADSSDATKASSKQSAAVVVTDPSVIDVEPATAFATDDESIGVVACAPVIRWIVTVPQPVADVNVHEYDAGSEPPAIFQNTYPDTSPPPVRADELACNSVHPDGGVGPPVANPVATVCVRSDAMNATSRSPETVPAGLLPVNVADGDPGPATVYSA
jgi:hypothetical protein